MNQLEIILDTKSIPSRLSKGNNHFVNYGLYVFKEYDRKLLQDLYRKFEHKNEAWIKYDNTYSCSTDGRVIKHYKTMDKIIIPYGKKNHRSPDVRYVKIHGKETKLSRFIYGCFNKNYDRNMSIAMADGDKYNCATYNLKAMTKKRLGKLTGGESRSIPVELLNEDGSTIDWYKSIRHAARENYISHEAVREHLVKQTESAAGLVFKYSEAI